MLRLSSKGKLPWISRTALTGWLKLGYLANKYSWINLYRGYQHFRCVEKAEDSILGRESHGIYDVNRLSVSTVARARRLIVINLKLWHSIHPFFGSGLYLDCQEAFLMRPKKVVLVVDADDIRVAVRRLILRTKGYEVHSVASLDLAMQEIIRRSPDVILCDAAIEGSTGEEFSRRVKKRYPNTPILLTSDRCKSPPNVIANVFLPAQSGPDVLLRMVKKFSAKNLGSKPKTAISARKEAIA